MEIVKGRLGMPYELGDKIKVHAIRVPIYANDYYTPSYQETDKVLKIVRVFDDGAYAVRFGKTSARFVVIDESYGIMSTKKCKWEIFFDWEN